MQPRRATVHEERLLSISGREMFCVDARDRDNPVVTAELELSWAVDRVVPVGEHLIEVANGYSWSGSPAPELRVVGAGAPDAVLLRQRLSEPLAILSAEVREGVLFVAQGETRWVPVDPAKPDGEYQSLGVVVLSTFDATRLPELPPLGSVKADVASLAWASELQALWPKRGLLVLVGRGQSYWRWGLLADVAGPGVARDMAPGLWWPWWGGGSGRLIAFDVADPVAPKLLSDLDLGTQNQSWGSSEVFLGDGLVFQSHQASEFIEGETLPGQAPPQPYEVVKPDGTRETVTPPVGIWVTKYYLDVVDYADPTTPTVRPPVNLPGSLIGVSRDAALLFTSGQHWDENWRTDGVEYLDVSAYDGVSVALVASLKLPAEWPRASTVVDSTIVLARRPSASETVGVIETWGLATDRTLRKLGELRLDVAAQALQAAGSLLAVQSDREILALDLTRPEALTVVGRGRADGCLWPTLGNARVGEGEALWLPLGEYGIMSVPLATPAGQGD
jgi:hypothetical protein